MNQPRGVLLVGSVPLASTEDVFTKLTSSLPNRLHSIPDGEPGSRGTFIFWQQNCFPPDTIYTLLGGDGNPNSSVPKTLTTYTLDSVNPTGYDDAAISSYVKFLDLRSRGIIPPDVRFQVSLPTPMNSVQGFVRPEYQPMLERLYEERILQALHRILHEIPARDLTIQWDLAYDIFALENEAGTLPDERFKAWFGPNVRKGIVERVERLCEDIPREVELGFHFCYGDYEHKHFLEPGDLGVVVDLANHLIHNLHAKAIHKVDYIHMPVPKARDDYPAYFEPLNDLRIGRNTYLYLGLVHAGDEKGTRERIEVAKWVWGNRFGVATECGLGRTGIDELDGILQISKMVTGEWGSDDGSVFARL